MPELHVLRVFCDGQGNHGNPLGVFISGGSIPAKGRQAVAAELGFSETVFVDDPARGEIRIFTPEVELPFAGHPTVGTAWLLRELGHEVTSLRAPIGELPVRFDDRTWVTVDPKGSPPFELREFGSAAEVEALEVAEVSSQGGWVYAWAWIDRAAGLVRTRAFVPEAGIPEDEATGSAATVLAAYLNEKVTIHQGVGSVIEAGPAGSPGLIEFGGFAVFDEVREHHAS